MIPIRYNLRSLMVRRATSIMTAVVVALVVMILFILSGFVAGLRATVLRSAAGENWIVSAAALPTKAAATSRATSTRSSKAGTKIATTSDGQALVSPEVVTGFNPAANQADAIGFGTLLRGVYPIARQVHSKMKLESRALD